MVHSLVSGAAVGSVAGAVCGVLTTAIFHGKALFNKSNLILSGSRGLLGMIPVVSFTASLPLLDKLQQQNRISDTTRDKLWWVPGTALGISVAAVSAIFMRHHKLSISYAESAANFILSLGGSLAVIALTERFFNKNC